jgi:acyl carrier protein
MAEDFEQIVRTAAEKLNLLLPTGELKKLDSLGMIDIVVELEAAAQITIPSASIDPARFASVGELATLLRELAE